MEVDVDDTKQLYELQEYDAAYDGVPFQPDVSEVRNMRIHEKSSGGGRLQTVLQLIQLILLVILLIVAVVILYRLYTSDSSDSSTAPFAGPTDKILTDTQSAVKEVSQIILAEIERRLNDTATLNRLAETTDVSLNAIFNVSNVANATSSAVLNLVSLTESLVLKIGSNYEEEREHLFNNTELLNRLINGTSASAAKLMNIVNTLSKLEGTGTSTAGVADDILLIVEELLELHNETAALPTSCKQIKQQQPYSPNGYYILAGASGTYSLHCNMDTLCGSGGGWTRLAYLDMTDAAQSCPFAFRLYQSGGVRACGRPVTNSASCASVTYPSNGISYSQICGRVVGYQWGGPDAGRSSETLNSYYVDGVSITRGSPRQHVWSLMADNGDRHCPCNVHNSNSPQSFIGNHYFCEAGATICCSATLHTSDPLWDGQGCDSTETACCNAPGIPWFHRDYGNSTTTDYIEMRICGDDDTYDEDAPVSFYEIYVK